jgi:SAM-dependent methyltransferase
LGIPQDLRKQRALDVGTWDGPIAFEMERRGAEVIALDIQDPERVGFAVARRILQSRVTHVRASVCELDQLDLGQFDHIAFRGVYYHLKSPILAFEQLAKALKVGGRLYFEGEAAINHIEDLDGNRVNVDLATLSRLRVPVAFSYPNHFKGASNWFIPNIPCMEGWLTASGLKLVSIREWVSDAPPYGGQRLIGIAVRERKSAAQLEHPLY